MHATHDIGRAVKADDLTLNEIERHIALAHDMRSQEMTDGLRTAAGRAARSWATLSRPIRTRLDRWATQQSLKLLSDRSLADIGIPREMIPLAARGIDWRSVDLDEVMWDRRLLRHMKIGLEMWRERLAQRRRMRGELQAYSDAELDDLGVFRADVPRLVRAATA